jgi:hypothetical protein
LKNNLREFLTIGLERKSTLPVRNTLGVALGYADFYDLVEDWRKREGGAA